MKVRMFAILLMLLLTLPLVSCASPNPMKDSLATVREQGSIKIQTNSPGENCVITDRETVKEICDTFSELSLRKTWTAEGLGYFCEVYFYDANGNSVLTVTLFNGKSLLYCNDTLYSFPIHEDLHGYLQTVIAQATQN